MSVAKKLEKSGMSQKMLKQFIPLNKLLPQQLKEISEKSSVIDLARGRTLFCEGDKDKSTYFLLSGDIDVITANEKTTLKASSKDTNVALFDNKPRPVTVQAKTRISVLCVDSGLLEVMLGHYHQENYQVSEIEVEQNTDWMTRFIQSLTSMNLPAQNMQGLLMRMQEVKMKAGETVINQSAKDDFYYIVKDGRCAVSRKASSKGGDVRLAELAEGDGFGEVALLTNKERSATVKMLNDGTLMRLSKQDFLELLAKPIINHVDFSDALSMVGEGAVFLDVRNISEHTKDGIIGSLNIPLHVLRLKLQQLEKNKTYIAYSDCEDAASAASFLLSQLGYASVVLKGGLKDVPANSRQSANFSGSSAGQLNKKGVVRTEKAGAEIVSLHSTASVKSVSSAAPNKTTDIGGELKKERDIAVNVPDEREFDLQAKIDAEREQRRTKKALKEKELAEAEAARLKQQLNAVNSLVNQKNEQISQGAVKLEQELKQEREKHEQLLSEFKKQADQKLQRELQEKLEHAQKLSEQEIRTLQQSADFLQARYLEEANKVQANETSLQEAENELKAVLNEQKKFRSENTELLEKFESEQSRLKNIEQAHQQAQSENEQLKAEMKQSQQETQDHYKNLIEENRDKLENELGEIKERMKDEKNRAAAAEEALRRAKEREEQLRLEAEEARTRADQDTKKIAQIQQEKIKELEDQVRQAELAEQARTEAEKKAARLKADAEGAKKRAELEARKYAEAEAARRRALEESEVNVQAAAEARERAESGTSRLRAEIEATRKSAEEALKRSSDAERARKEAEQEIKKQTAVIDGIRQEEDEEKSRVVMSEQARKKAELEVKKLRKQLETQKKAALEARKKEQKLHEESLKKHQTATAHDDFAANDDEILVSDTVQVSAEMQASEILLGKKEKKSNINVGEVRKSGFISDALLWETTLGMREDEEAEQYLGAPVEPLKVKKVEVAKAKAASVKKARNPNESTFAVREVGQDGPVSQRVSLKADVPVLKQDSSSGKGLIIGSFLAISIAIGVGAYITLSQEDGKLPSTITTIMDKARDVETAFKNATNGKTTEVADVEKALLNDPDVLASEEKILKQRAEMNARNAAQVEFSKLKVNAPVVSRATALPPVATEEAAINDGRPVVDDVATPSVNVLPINTPNSTTQADNNVGDGVQSGSNAVELSSDVGSQSTESNMPVKSSEVEVEAVKEVEQVNSAPTPSVVSTDQPPVAQDVEVNTGATNSATISSDASPE